VGLGPVVNRARVLVHEVLNRGAQAVVHGSARYASQLIGRGAQVNARGAAQVLHHSAKTDARGAAQVVERGAQAVARGGAQVLDRVAQAVSRGGAQPRCPGRFPRRRSLFIAGLS